MLLELVCCCASVLCRGVPVTGSLAHYANLLGDGGRVRVKKCSEIWPRESQNCGKQTAASHSGSQERSVKQWLITSVCLSVNVGVCPYIEKTATVYLCVLCGLNVFLLVFYVSVFISQSVSVLRVPFLAWTQKACGLLFCCQSRRENVM